VKALPIPDEVKDPEKAWAFEVARVWLDDGGTWVSLKPDMEIGAALESWGPILADVAATIIAHMPQSQSAEWRQEAFGLLSSSFVDHLKMRL
jgi:hypothetical protein